MNDTATTPALWPVLQTIGLVLGLGWLAVAPMTSAARLVVPLRTAARPAVLAHGKGWQILARGPGQSVVVRGGAVNSAALLRAGYLILAAPRGGCADEARA